MGVVPPHPSHANYNIIVKTSAQEIEIKSLMTSGTITDGVTNSIGSFEFQFLDPGREYLELINKFDEVIVYGGYGANPTSVIFKGKIERIGYSDINIIISGRSNGMILSGTSVIYETRNSNGNLEAKKRSNIIREIILKYDSTINVDDIEVDDVELQKSYFEIPFMDVIEELAGNHHAFYLDHSNSAHYFLVGSRNNSTEAIVEDINHLETIDNSEDAEEIVNSVRVYGKSYDGVPIIATSKTDTTNTQGIRKDIIINNTSAVTTIQAKELADLELARLKVASNIKSISSFFLPTIVPGEAVFVSVPREGIPPIFYEVNQFTHTFNDSAEVAASTEVSIQKQRLDISGIIKKNVVFKSKISENDNPYDLDESKIITFDVDSGTHKNTIISEGYLQMKPGESSGKWVSDVIQLEHEVDELELRMSGENLIKQYGVYTSNLRYSLDGGATSSIVPVGGGLVSASEGTDLVFEINLKSDDAHVKAVGALLKYKIE